MYLSLGLSVALHFRNIKIKDWVSDKYLNTTASKTGTLHKMFLFFEIGKVIVIATETLIARNDPNFVEQLGLCSEFM